MNYLREFLKYTLPSIMGMAVSSAYVITDGIFIGRGVGSTALAAINIVWPLIAVIQALSMMVSVGGGTMMAIRFGEGKTKAGNDIFLQSFISLLLAIGIFSFLGVLFADFISTLMGASPLLLPDAVAYLRFFLIFGIFWCISIFLSVFVRNDGDPNLVFAAMATGALCNIILDYLFIFVFHQGVAGAAIASGIGQLGSVAILSLHFIKKRGRLRLYRIPYSWKEQWRIIKVGTPEFTTELSYPLNIFFYNIVLIHLMNELAVAAYCVISYIITISFSIFLGVSTGIQPLISHAFGGKEFKAVKAYFRIGLFTNFGLALIVYGLTYWLAPHLVAIMNTEPDLIQLTTPALRTYSLSIIFSAMTVVCITYFLSIKETRIANTITIGRGLISNALFIPLIPLIFGTKAIWTAGIWAEAASFLLAMICLRYAKRKSTPH